MKLETSKITGVISNPVSEIEAGIGNASLLLEYLRDHIYKNPVMALTREYASNARDAHREVNNSSRPIEITFPNTWDSGWSVKDYGPGISPDRMENILTKFGNSTKRDSNDQTGAFGLGAKSGWAYSDSFNITTIYDGIKYYYSAVLDGGAGKMVLLSKEETTESSGTTITVPVSGQDYDQFVKYTLLATSFWDVKPILKGIVPAPEYVQVDKIISGTGWYLANPKSIKGIDGINGQSYAIVDGIPYSIELYSFSGLSYKEQDLLRCSLHIEFNVGDLDLAPSRDNLRYTSKTQEAIRAKLKTVLVEAQAEIEKGINNAPTYLEALKSYLGLKNPETEAFLKLVPTPTWNGEKLEETVMVKSIGPWTKLQVIKLDWGTLRSSRTYDSFKAVQDNGLILFNRNEKAIPKKGIQMYLEDSSNPYKKVTIITCPKEPKTKEFLREKQYNPSIKVEYNLNILDKYEIGDMDLFPFPKAPRQTGTGGRIKAADGNIMAYSISESSRGSLELNVQEIINDTGGVYVEVDYVQKSLTSNGKALLFSELSRMANILEVSTGDYGHKRIYGFSKTRVKKLSSNWIPLETAIKDKVNEILKQYPLDTLKKAAVSGNHTFDSVFSLSSIKDSLINLDDSSLIKQFMLKSEQINEYSKLYNNLYPILKWLDIDCTNTYVSDLETIAVEAAAKYKMLSFMGYGYSGRVEEIIRYIKAVDFYDEAEKKEKVKNPPLVLVASN